MNRLQIAIPEVGSVLAFRWLKALLNGMPTAVRCTQSATPCLLCRVADDRLEHLVHCEALNDVISRRFPHLAAFPGPVLRWEFLSLTQPGAPTRHSVEAIVFLDVLSFVHEAVWHGSLSQPHEIAEGRLRQLKLRSARLRLYLDAGQIY
jgi:hypothetical protein